MARSVSIWAADGDGLHRLVAARVGHLRRSSISMSSGSASTTGPGTAAGGDLEGARHVFGDAVGAVDLRHPFGHLAVHAPVVDFLERFAVDEVVADLADEQDHRRRILVRRVHADRGVGRAGAARDEADAGLAGQLAVGLGHEGRAAFLAADDEADARVVQRVEHVEVAFAGHAEGGVDAVDGERVDQDLAAGAGRVGHGSVVLRWWASSHSMQARLAGLFKWRHQFSETGGGFGYNAPREAGQTAAGWHSARCVAGGRSGLHRAG